MDIEEVMAKEIASTSHKIVEVDGIRRWEQTLAAYDLNTRVADMLSRGITKNDEEWRNLYRSIGYSLSAYWEVFYWEMNNEIASEYWEQS